MDAPHESYRNHQVYSEGQLLVVSYLAVSHTNPQESGFALAPQVRARRVRHTEVPHESYRNHQVYSELLTHYSSIKQMKGGVTILS